MKIYVLRCVLNTCEQAHMLFTHAHTKRIAQNPNETNKTNERSVTNVVLCDVLQTHYTHPHTINAHTTPFGKTHKHTRVK